MCELLEVYTVVIHVMLTQIPRGRLGMSMLVEAAAPVLWPRASGLRETDCTGEAEASSGPPQLMKQGNIPCNHSIYSGCWQKGGCRAGNLVKYEEKLGQASIKD